ncbi:MAG: EAL domain-containing protein [Steroidobacteraceae bacterium]
MAKILIVDDDHAGRDLLVTLVRYKGHQAFEAADGADALDLVRRERPQLVIADVLMPTMDGYEFVRRLREDPEVAGTEVIFYTASYHEREAVDLAGTGGVSRVLIKPCEPSQILDSIDEVLRGGAEIDSAAVPAEFDHEHLRLLTNKLWHRSNELEIANARLAALTELHTHLASQRDPQVLLEQVCHGARKLFGAKYAVLAAREKHGTSGQVIFATSGIDRAAVPLQRPAIDAGALGRVLTTGKPWRVARDDGITIDAGLPRSYPRAHSFLSVPLASLTQIYGWICLAEKVGADAFGDADEQLLAILGAQVGRIYENGSLYVELQHRAHRVEQAMAEHEKAAVGLRDSEERFRQLAENIQDAFFLASADLKELLYLSPAYGYIWGQSEPEGLTCSEVLMQAIHPADAVRVKAEFRKIAKGAAESKIEYRIVRPDGAVRWILLRTFPVIDVDSVGSRIVGTAKDVTESRAAEAKIIQLNRVYAVLSSINTLIVRVNSRDELFKESCRLAVEFGHFAFAWIGGLDPQTGAIPGLAWAGKGSLLAQSLQPVMGSDPTQDGIVAAALRKQRPQFTNDIATDPRLIVFREPMLKYGFNSVIALPLVIDNESTGCLVLAAEESGFFNEDELRLLDELASDISFALDHIAKAERLRYLAYYDSLTGLANRTLFLDRLAQHLANATTNRQKVAVVAMTPERLRNINDTFGRAAGDMVLTQFAERYAASVGSQSSVARVSGDQIAALIGAVTEESELLRTVSRWQDQCFNQPFLVHGSPMRLAAITGIAVFPDDGGDAATILQNAESALERAKTTGDTHLFYTQRMSIAVTEKLMLEHALREAQERHEFLLHYQPKVNLESRKVTGLEALIRWQNLERGLVSPATFIPLMEDTGMIVSIGAWVMREAATERKRWLQLGVDAPRIAVNVSTVQLRKRDFVDTVKQILAEAGEAPGIDIEVTESLIMDDVDSNLRKLDEIRSMGVGIALDDFGTGYSSLGYLAKLPLSSLKIDRSFVSRMLDDPGAMTLISTMIQLAHSLNLNVVAEGVETEEQAKILRLLRCDEIQGYLISKPLPFDQMTEFLKR